MPSLDLTFDNGLISSYFEGSNDYVPTSELIYAHTHLIKDSFLSQIERLVNITHEVVSDSSVSVKPKLLNKIVNASEDLGRLIPTVNEDTAPRILELLREIYQACGRILEKYDVDEILSKQR